MHDTGCLGLVHWNDPEGWYGEGGGRRVQDGVQGKKLRLKLRVQRLSPEVTWLPECPVTIHLPARSGRRSVLLPDAAPALIMQNSTQECLLNE